MAKTTWHPLAAVLLAIAVVAVSFASAALLADPAEGDALAPPITAPVDEPAAATQGVATASAVLSETP